jgi:hypothetical protein
MKQIIECPLCDGHGISRIECAKKSIRLRLWLARALSALIRKLTKQEEP